MRRTSLLLSFLLLSACGGAPMYGGGTAKQARPPSGPYPGTPVAGDAVAPARSHA